MSRLPKEKVEFRYLQVCLCLQLILLLWCC